jgi:cyanophycin synthetase
MKLNNNKSNKSNIIYILFFVLLFGILIVISYKQINNDEHFLNIGHSDFLKVYPRYNIKFDKSTRSIYKDNNNNNKISRKEMNPTKCKKIIDNKHNTMMELKKHNIPIPKSMLFTKSIDNLDDLETSLKNNKINYPIVIKPVNGKQGNGVNVGIKTIEELKKIITDDLNKYDKLQIQEEIQGENYRILVINGNIIDIIQRERPYVISDGKLTIQELINKRNKIQLRNKNRETYHISLSYIKDQGYGSLELIPDKNKTIYITNTINYHNGSNIKRYPINKVHSDNIKMFLKTMNVLNCNISGIDYITTDLSKSYKEHGVIIELNSGPYYNFHKYKSNPLYMANKIVEQLDKYYDLQFK